MKFKILSLIIFFFVNSILSQDTYNLYVDAKESKVTEFERELIVNLFKLKNRKDGKKDILNFIKMSTFSEAFDHMQKNQNTEFKNRTLAINEISFTEERNERFDFSSAYMFNKYTIMTLNDRSDLKKIKQFDSNYHYGAVKGSIFE